jgi:glyoxalase family protein
MRLHGIHHITAITADAPRNVDFYARVLGLRLVKKTVNFDAPEFYHLYFGDERARPGSLITFFEFPDAAPGVAGAGMVHRIVWRVASPEALDFWAGRLRDEGLSVRSDESSLLFRDPEGLELELTVVHGKDEPLIAKAADIPAEHALQGFESVRAYTANINASHDTLVDTLGFTPMADGVGFRLMGGSREALYHFDPAPAVRPHQGAGTVHHVAFASTDEEHAAWQERVRAAGLPATDIIDRQYFRSIYFREPSGVLFELATPSPGFTVDEAAEHLGEALKLPPRHEHMRARLQQNLTPVSNPRAALAGS